MLVPNPSGWQLHGDGSFTKGELKVEIAQNFLFFVSQNGKNVSRNIAITAVNQFLLSSDNYDCNVRLQRTSTMVAVSVSGLDRFFSIQTWKLMRPNIFYKDGVTVHKNDNTFHVSRLDRTVSKKEATALVHSFYMTELYLYAKVKPAYTEVIISTD